MNAIYLGELYTKDELVKMVAELRDVTSYINLMISLLEQNRCMDCGNPIKTVNYVNKCGHNPDEHTLGDAVFCIKKIKKRLEKHALHIKRK